MISSSLLDLLRVVARHERKPYVRTFVREPYVCRSSGAVVARSVCCTSVIDAKFTAGYADVDLSYSSSQNVVSPQWRRLSELPIVLEGAGSLPLRACHL